MVDAGKLGEQFKEQAAQAGISGDAVMECRPRHGYMRLKVTWNPPERQVELTKSLSETVSALLQMMGVQVKARTE